MKSFAALLLAAFLIAPVVAQADTNVALHSNGGTAIFGYNNGSTATLGTPYDHAGGTGDLNDGIVNGGGGDDTYGQPNPSDGYVGATFTLSPTLQVNSIVFYGRNFVDGGWFGYNTVAPLGANSTLTAMNLIAPTVQYTLNGGTTWINDTLETNDYVTQFTGATASGGAATNAATFTLTTPLIGIDGIRLIGEDGGYASGGGGFLGADEIEVFAGAVPEPSTWALMLGGAAALAFVLRVRVVRV